MPEPIAALCAEAANGAGTFDEAATAVLARLRGDDVRAALVAAVATVLAWETGLGPESYAAAEVAVAAVLDMLTDSQGAALTGSEGAGKPGAPQGALMKSSDRPPAGRASCWEDMRDADGNGHTCLLDDGHEGPHWFTPDADIVIHVSPREGDDIAIRLAPQEGGGE